MLRAYSWNQEIIIVGEPVLAGKRHALFDAILVRGMHRGGATEGAAAFRVLALEQMPLAGAGTQHLAAGGNLEPLGRGFLGFDALRTSHKDKSAFVKKEREI